MNGSHANNSDHCLSVARSHQFPSQRRHGMMRRSVRRHPATSWSISWRERMPTSSRCHQRAAKLLAKWQANRRDETSDDGGGGERRTPPSSLAVREGPAGNADQSSQLIAVPPTPRSIDPSLARLSLPSTLDGLEGAHHRRWCIHHTLLPCHDRRGAITTSHPTPAITPTVANHHDPRIP